MDPADPENFRRATDARNRAYYAETLPNPKLTVFPIAEVAAIGRPLGIPLVVDNTAARCWHARSIMAQPSSFIRRPNILAAMARP